jgi:hypothetical protein
MSQHQDKALSELRSAKMLVNKAAAITARAINDVEAIKTPTMTGGKRKRRGAAKPKRTTKKKCNK